MLPGKATDSSISETDLNKLIFSDRGAWDFSEPGSLRATHWSHDVLGRNLAGSTIITDYSIPSRSTRGGSAPSPTGPTSSHSGPIAPATGTSPDLEGEADLRYDATPLDAFNTLHGHASPTSPRINREADFEADNAPLDPANISTQTSAGADDIDVEGSIDGEPDWHQTPPTSVQQPTASTRVSNQSGQADYVDFSRENQAENVGNATKGAALSPSATNSSHEAFSHQTAGDFPADRTPHQKPQSSLRRRRKPCPHCPKTYAYKRGLNAHVKVQHTGPMAEGLASSEPLFLECTQCGRHLKGKKALASHMTRTHASPRRKKK